MKEIHFNTLAECENFINISRQYGNPVPEAVLAERKRLKSLPQRGKVATGDTPIYTTLVNNYPYGEMPEEKKKCIEDTVNQLLENGPKAEEPGLLLGKIQCGKTDTFEDIIGLAFDRGIDIAIILTKGTKSLAQQTLKRLKKDFHWFKETGDLDQPVTIYIEDILNVWHKLRQNKVDQNKCIFVCKKESTNLKHLIEMFDTNEEFLHDKRVLIVDDEADFASRNYRNVRNRPLTDADGFPIEQERETELAVISQLIDRFRKIPSYCRYLQVTATPYCLYLQPQGVLNLNGQKVEPFRPRFTSLVPVHDAYIGGKQYFEESKDPESMYHYLFHQVSEKCLKVMGNEDKRYLNNATSSANIYDFTYALVSYFVATAIRRIQVRETKHKDYRSSALLHIELNRRYHEWQCRLAKRVINDITDAVVNDDRSDLRVWRAVDASYDDFVASNEKGRQAGLIDIEVPAKDTVLNELRDILKRDNHNYVVQPVNIDNDVDTLLDEETGELKLEAAANIFIGGSILDRGITIKNMLCFFYGRNPKNFQQDTVLQHARMYGARSKEDMAVTRFHTSSAIYHILSRMNELDNRLRDAFVKGYDQNVMEAVFVGHDKHIKPCAAQKIKASDALTLKGEQRLVPFGMWTGSNTAIKKTIAEMDKLIAQAKEGQTPDSDGFFEMDKETAMRLLQLAESTFVYDSKHGNLDHKGDMKELCCALEYSTQQSYGKLYALHRTNRNMSRVRANGGFIDAPDDGRTDLAPAHEKTKTAPVVMFLRQNGQKEEVDGENIGWNNAPFYWPVFITQDGLQPVMFALDQRSKGTGMTIDLEKFLSGIDEKELLKLTYGGNMEAQFGPEGTERPIDDCEVETRWLKNTNASMFIEMDENGRPRINPDVPFDTEHDHGLYSYNNGVFPFVLRKYKYMLLRNGRNANSPLMLLELYQQGKQNVYPVENKDEHGNLLDDDKTVLVYGKDTIYDRNMKETEFEDDTLALWYVQYPVKRVLKVWKPTKE